MGHSLRPLRVFFVSIAVPEFLMQLTAKSAEGIQRKGRKEGSRC
jgi:hypothetical protein